MKEIEEIKDINGKAYLSIGIKQEEEKKNIGNKFEDFEFLKELGRGNFGKVLKVSSKLNNKVYAMKIVDLEKLNNPENERAYQLALNESKFLTDLSHPHIIKYYKSFKEGDYLYLIVENAENGDLADFMDAHKKSWNPISEEVLWSIFLQCMKGLAYVHKMGVIHRDIKLGNILMDNNMNIKIGDFGVSAVKKNKGEINDNPNVKYLNASYMQYGKTYVVSKGYEPKEMREMREYDQKIDVYSMGVSFHELCFFRKPKKNGDINNGNNANYSEEMINIIKEMIEEDKEKRQSSEYFLEKIRNEFDKRYNRNTSIDAIVRCLFTFNDITTYFKNLNEDEIKDKPLTKAFKNCLINFTEKKICLYTDSIKYFREILCIENKKFDKTKEIDPKLVLDFLIMRLHNEMNINISLDNKANNYFIKSGEEKARTSKEEMLFIFQNKFLSLLNSYLSQKMMGLSKNVYICEKCKMKTYSFCGYFFVTIDLPNIIRYIPPDIEHYFYIINKAYIYEEKYCTKCLVRTEHKKFKQFFTAPDYLIVIIQRGKNNECRIPFKLKTKIDLSDLIETQGKMYKLVGFINRSYEREKYTSFIEFQYSNKWFKCEGESINGYNPNVYKDMFNDSNGELVMAFYEAIGMH